MRKLALALALAASLPVVAHAKRAPKADKDDDGDDGDDDDKKKPAAKPEPKKAEAAPAKKDKDDSDDEDDDDDSDDKGGGGFSNGKKIKVKESHEEPMVKQDLNGHDMGTQKKKTEFERDRFFVDKTDTEKTEGHTLVQGSLTSSSFAYTEFGGGTLTTLGGMPLTSGQSTSYSRLFTDLRLQTDFRHISGGKWDARIDGRIRFVEQQDPVASPVAQGMNVATPTPYTQSGLLGQNEYDLRELWLIRNGERTDLTFGRQYITDLAAIKIDGLRVDYASSKQLTYVGFAGLNPFRGSRSITTDYIDLKNPTDLTPAGQFIGAGGFGAAYRTPQAYGAFGGVIQQALDGGGETRIFGTANGYWRVNPKLDIYHYAVLDGYATNGSAQITNLTGGLNYKPTNRLRLTASYNRVDTESLAIQAGAYLDQGSQANAVNNEIFLSRLTTNNARGSISAGLGDMERFEVTIAITYKNRPGFTLDPVTTSALNTPLTLKAEKGYEVFGSIIDRHSVANLRLGLDGLSSFAVGDIAYQHTNVFVLRAFAGREYASGKGEWELEGSYSSTEDQSVAATAGMFLSCDDPASCFGVTNGTIISLGGSTYYRLNRDWFIIAQAYLTHTALTVHELMGTVNDPAINGLSGYFRIAYRF
ncbi:MAG: hypothetical protein QM831_00150 [Kofleriaceae bacterium]